MRDFERRNYVSPFEDRVAFAVEPHLFVDTSKMPDFIQMYDEGRGVCEGVCGYRIGNKR